MELKIFGTRLTPAEIRILRAFEVGSEEFNITRGHDVNFFRSERRKRQTILQCLLYGYMRTNLEKTENFLVYREDDTAREHKSA